MFTESSGIVEAITELAISPIGQWVLELFVSATIVLALAWIASWSGRRWSAAIRHRIWCLSFCGLLVLPLALLLLPPLEIPLLPPAKSNPVLSVGGQTASVAHVGNLLPPSNSIGIEYSNRDEPESSSGNFDSFGPWVDEQPNHSTAVAVGSRLPKAAATAAVSNDSNRKAIGLLLLVIWIIGVVAATAPLLIYAWSNHRRFIYGIPIHDQKWNRLLSELCRAIGIRQEIQLLGSRQAIVPLTWGIFHPKIAIPRKDIGCSLSARRAVLLHELAHVQRRDVLVQFVGRVACGLYWFHPLAWFALRKLRLERELACDDLVLSAGEKPSEYARQLVHFARRLKRQSSCLTAAMASTSKLEYRITSLLDRARSRMAVTKNAARVLLACTLLTIFSLAMIRIGHQTIADSPRNDLGAINTAVTNSNASVNLDTNVNGIVKDSSGTPVGNATVVLVYTRSQRTGWVQQHEVIGDTQTNADGEFQIAIPAESMSRLGYHQTFMGGLKVAASRDGLIPDWQTVYDWYNGWSRTNIDLRLENECPPVKGRLIDQEGNPLSNVSVKTVSVSEPKEDADLDQWHNNASHNSSPRDRMSMLPGAETKVHYFPSNEIVHTLGFPVLHQTTQTNANGEFLILNVGKDRLVRLEFERNGIAKSRTYVITRRQTEVPYPTKDPRDRPQICFGATFEIAIQPSQDIFGVVRDQDTNEPISGVKISVRGFGSDRLSVSGFAESTTDTQGRYRIEGIPRPDADASATNLTITPSSDSPYFPQYGVSVRKVFDLGPVELNHDLKKGVWATGKLVNAKTDAPLTGWLNYHPSLENENAEEYSNFDRNRFLLNPNAEGTWRTDEKGNFRIPVIPGKALITAIADRPMFFQAGFSEDELKLPRGIQNIGVAAPEFYHFVLADTINAAKLIDIDALTTSENIAIRLSPLPIKTIKLRGPDGQPVSRVRSVGTFSRSNLSPQLNLRSVLATTNDEVNVYGLADDGPRLVVFHQPELDIGKAITLDSNGPDEVILEPCGIIRGKVTGLEGMDEKPTLVEVQIPASSVPKGKHDMYHAGHRISSAKIQPDGSFETTGIIPGVDYVVRIGKTVRTIPKERKRVTDLGEIKLAPPNQPDHGKPLPSIEDQ